MHLGRDCYYMDQYTSGLHNAKTFAIKLFFSSSDQYTSGLHNAKTPSTEQPAIYAHLIDH